jgi:hypothetical protein
LEDEVKHVVCGAVLVALLFVTALGPARAENPAAATVTLKGRIIWPDTPGGDIISAIVTPGGTALLNWRGRLDEGRIDKRLATLLRRVKKDTVVVITGRLTGRLAPGRSIDRSPVLIVNRIWVPSLSSGWRYTR